MDVSSLGGQYANMLKPNSADEDAKKLSSKISGLGKDSSDEELMDACKSFEAYLIEQVIKSSKKAMLPENEDEEGDYMKCFGDQLNQSYAKLISENANLGIAQKLFESIKRNQQ